MAITTYSELQTAVANWMHRTDLTTRIPEFISLCESRLNRDLRCGQMEDSTTGTIAVTNALPSDFLEARALTVASGGITYRLAPKSLTEVRQLYYQSIPLFYAVSGTDFIVGPQQIGATYTLDYYAQIPALATAVGSTNWLLTAYPDIYLYGTLMEAAPFTRDVTAAQGFDTIYQTRVNALTSADSRRRYGTAPTMNVDFGVIT